MALLAYSAQKFNLLLNFRYLGYFRQAHLFMILSNIFLHLFKINMYVYLIDEFAPVPETSAKSADLRAVKQVKNQPNHKSKKQVEKQFPRSETNHTNSWYSIRE